MSKKTPDAFAKLVWLATDRVYSPSTDLIIDLDADPTGTLQRLITEPQAFGTLRSLPDKQRMDYINQLITIARAYVVHKRKRIDHDQSQPTLDLPKPKP